LNDNSNVKYFEQFSSSACSKHSFPHSGGEESTYAVYVIMNTTLVSNELWSTDSLVPLSVLAVEGLQYDTVISKEINNGLED
jgi:hypothetical protein